MKDCKECGKSLEGKPKSQKFCSRSCGVIYNNKTRVVTDETKEKLRASAIKHSIGKHKASILSIWELSSRTVQKIIKRLGLGCSSCGWDKGSCDIHHIEGRKITDPHNHKNLTLLCPNCHRLVHEDKIKKEDLKTFEEILPDNWMDSYYG
jgi:predicted HNH restriction endonuclease